MLDIALTDTGDRPVRLGSVADRTGISRRYLDQVVMPLKSASLLLGIKGRSGGYRLARAADEIRLGEIVEATIGPVTLVDCVGAPETCERSEACAAHVLYRYVSASMRNQLDELTLADLGNPSVIKDLAKRTVKLESLLA
jgi:Rrf2 family protein